MATLNSDEGYALHVKDGDDVYECALYSLQDEATPTTSNAGTGTCWKMTHSGVTCYVGLWPAAATNTPPKASTDADEKSIITPLTIKKNDVVYNVLRYVLNTFTITLKGTVNQTYTFTYYDANNEQQTANVSTDDVVVTALAGTAYACSVTPAEHYLAGTPSCGASGYVNSNMTVEISDATNNLFVMTVSVPTGATITVNGTTYSTTTNVSYDGGTSLTISCDTTNDVQYAVSGLTANGVSINSPYTMPTSAVTITCTSTVRTYTLKMSQATGTTLTVKANGSNALDVTQEYVYNYGTSLDYSVADSDSTDAYENPTVSAGGY